MNDKRRRGSLVWPVMLIGLGLVFLLNNMGYLSWSVWEVILRLWPVLLIAGGLDLLLLGQRSAWGSLLAMILTLAVLGGALVLAGTDMDAKQSLETERISQPLEDQVTRARVIIDRGVGFVRVEPLRGSTALIEGTVPVGRRQQVMGDYSVAQDQAEFVVRAEGTSFGPIFIGWGGHRAWELGLNPDVPLRLKFALGVGEYELDLTGLALDELEVSLGIGRTEVILPSQGQFQGRIDNAIGETVILIPGGMAARIQLDVGLAGRGLPSDFRQVDDNVYESSGYRAAEDRIDLQIDHAIGNVSIRRR